MTLVLLPILDFTKLVRRRKVSAGWPAGRERHLLLSVAQDRHAVHLLSGASCSYVPPGASFLFGLLVVVTLTHVAAFRCHLSQDRQHHGVVHVSSFRATVPLRGLLLFSTKDIVLCFQPFTCTCLGLPEVRPGNLPSFHSSKKNWRKTVSASVPPREPNCLIAFYEHCYVTLTQCQVMLARLDTHFLRNFSMWMGTLCLTGISWTSVVTVSAADGDLSHFRIGEFRCPFSRTSAAKRYSSGRSPLAYFAVTTSRTRNIRLLCLVPS